MTSETRPFLPRSRQRSIVTEAAVLSVPTRAPPALLADHALENSRRCESGKKEPSRTWDGVREDRDDGSIRHVIMRCSVDAASEPPSARDR